MRLAGGVELAGEKGTEHLSARGVRRMLVVVCRSHWSWRQTSFPSLVKVTSHSRMPAPIRAPASWLSLGVLGELQRPTAAVADGEGGLVKRAIGTGLELSLELAVAQLIDKIERAGAELHILSPFVMGMLVPLGSVIRR